MTTGSNRLTCLAAVVLLACAAPAIATAAVDVVAVDLEPLIKEGAKSPVQFAVHIPHPISSATAGEWNEVDGVATWRYSVQIPTAISMSFHANRVSVPADAVLTVKSALTTIEYRGAQLNSRELWSRVQPGDSLDFALTTAKRSEITFEISSFQAGYRALGGAIKNHPYYSSLQTQVVSNANSQCVQNYKCGVTSANSNLAQATVGVVVGNTYQCTGTLINNLTNDNTPYVLTARHCETGKLGGGNAGAASTATIYWDATTPCGSTLGKIYDANVLTQSGAGTVVEQQDAWLIQLDKSPVVTDAYFAGFDASGGPVQGGYTIHHALGFTKQLTAWFDLAVSVQRSNVLGSTYVSNFWQVVNQQGNIGPGASGAGLIDQNDHLVGILTLGRATDDSSGYESCPINPAPPNGSNGVADFTSFAAVWNSTADSSSTTGNITLKSVLDPASTGATVAPSIPAANVTLSANATAQIGLPASLTWSAPSPAQCVPSGGASGDGWTGTLGNSGTLSVTENTPGSVKYVITCTLSGGRKISTSTTIVWLGPTPQVSIYSSNHVWTTRPAGLSWNSNVAPCAITGGSVSQSGLPASGSISTTQDTPGDVKYQINCGTGATKAMNETTVSYSTPSLLFEANSTDRLFGEPLYLDWHSFADSCIPSGGGMDDHWSTSTLGPTNILYLATVPSTGIYTYTLTCSSGPIVLQKTVSVNVANAPGYVTTSVNQKSLTYTGTPADYLRFTWKSNLTNCTFTSTPFLGTGVPGTDPQRGLSSYYPEDQFTVAPPRSGVYEWRVMCSSATTLPQQNITSTPIVVTVLPPPAATATISVTPTSVAVGVPYTVAWSSTNASFCTSTGNFPDGSPWGNGGHLDPSGTRTITPNAAGQFTIGVSCRSIDDTQSSATAQTSVTISTVAVNVSASLNTGSISKGDTYTLTWSSSGATSCSASGGGANGSQWTGSLATSGSVTQTATTTGLFTYTVTCSNPVVTNQAQASLAVAASSSGSGGGGGSSGSSGGGGGSIRLLELGWLLLALAWRQRRVIWARMHG